MRLASAQRFPIQQHSRLVRVHAPLLFNHLGHILWIPLDHLISHSDWRSGLLLALILILFSLLLILLIVTPHIHHGGGDDIPPHDPEDQEQPEKIHGLQNRQQTEGDALREKALELPGLPVELERANGAELGEGRVEDGEVDVVAEVDPDEDEEAKVGADDRGVEVVEGFRGLDTALVWSMSMISYMTYGEEEIANVVGDVDCNAHLCEVKAIAQPDQRDRKEMVQDQLLEVLPRLFQLEEQHDALLTPVARLQEIVCLEDPLVLFMGKALKHSGRVEIPQRAPRHDVHAKRSKDGKIHGRVDLLHEAGLFGSAPDATANGPRPNDALHQELSRETEHDGVEGHERNVTAPLAVEDRTPLGLWGLRVGEEDGPVERVGI